MKPHEEIKAKIVRQWLAKAQEDVEAAEALMSENHPLYHPSCFHSQQAAEKFIKAYLTWHQIEFPKIHVFGELLDLVAIKNGELAEALSPVTSLNPYGVEVRYPGDAPEPTRDQAESALALARDVRDAIIKELPSDLQGSPR